MRSGYGLASFSCSNQRNDWTAPESGWNYSTSADIQCQRSCLTPITDPDPFSFDRGLHVRVADIVWVADAPTEVTSSQVVNSSSSHLVLSHTFFNRVVPNGGDSGQFFG